MNNVEEEIRIEQELRKAMKETGLTPKEGFKTLYLALFGKDHGPKLAAFIMANRKVCAKRFKEASEKANVNKRS